MPTYSVSTDFIEKYTIVDHICSFISNFLLRKELKKVEVGKIIIGDYGSPFMITEVKNQGPWKCKEVLAKRLDSSVYYKISCGYCRFKITDYIESKYKIGDSIHFKGAYGKHKNESFLIVEKYASINENKLIHSYGIQNGKLYYGFVHEKDLYTPQYNQYWATLNK